MAFVLVDDDTSFTDPASFGSTTLTKNYKTIIYESHQDCQDALMRMFSNTPQEYSPKIEKHDDDAISITTIGNPAFTNLNVRNRFVCKEITLQ